jgi:hypothetical protein
MSDSKDKTDRIMGPNESTKLPDELADFVAKGAGDTAKDNAERSGVSEQEAQAVERAAENDSKK